MLAQMPASLVLRDLVPWGFVGVAVACIGVGFLLGERDAERHYVKRFRARARYLRWLSMSCLCIMGAMVTTATTLAGEKQPGGLIAFGLVAAVLASVYRYIVRLSYFYDARADGFDLLTGTTVPEFRAREAIKSLEDYAQLVAILSPDRVEYSSASTALKSAADLLKPTKTEE